MANFTKNAIRASFMKLLDERPLSKITVKDITDDCGINRNSFYYHYQDIPSLIQEIFTQEIERIIQDHPSIDRLEDCISIASAFAVENKRAILHVYNSVNRDIFEQYLWRACEQTVVTYFRTAFPEARLSDEDRSVLLHFHTCNTFGLVCGWLNSGMRLDMNAFSARLCEITRGMLAEMIRRCENKNRQTPRF